MRRARTCLGLLGEGRPVFYVQFSTSSHFDRRDGHLGQRVRFRPRASSLGPASFFYSPRRETTCSLWSAVAAAGVVRGEGVWTSGGGFVNQSVVAVGEDGPCGRSITPARVYAEIGVKVTALVARCGFKYVQGSIGAACLLPRPPELV